MPHDDLQKLVGRCALILGDVMLDEYLWGDVRRISPEAPVPVVEIRRRTRTAGGAANVAANIAALSGHAIVAGVIGADAAGESLSQLLASHGVDTSGLIVTQRPTTTKSRVIAHQQQVLRFDDEERGPLSAGDESHIREFFSRHIAGADVCVVSDYAKGVVSPALSAEFISLSRRHGKPVVVDPKSRDFSRYRCADVVTPNLLEACLAAGVDPLAMPPLEEIGDRLLRDLEGCLLITRGADGMSLFTRAGNEVHIASVARSVFDVTGAGDTMISALAMAMAADYAIEEAARIANIAAGVVVGRFGTSSVSLAELQQAVREGLHESALPMD